MVVQRDKTQLPCLPLRATKIQQLHRPITQSYSAQELQNQ